MVNYDESGLNTLNLAAVVGRFGYFITENFAIEARAGTGVADDSINVSGVDVAIELNRLLSIYGVGKMSVSENVSAYGLIGYSSAKVTATATNVVNSPSSSAYDNGLSYGIGIQFDAGKNFNYNAEYTNYLDGSDYDLSAFSVGLSVGF